MSLLQTLVLVLHVLAAIAICGFVLLQHGKGADMGAAFGGGSSGSLFGASGSANFLSRTTAVLAAIFFTTSVALTWFASQHGAPVGVMEKAAAEQSAVPAPTAPASKSSVDAAGKAASGAAGAPASDQVPGAAGPASPGTAAPAPGKTPAEEVPK
ncbi:MAG: preprotein translocase subunit SecG [Proteobacteria bacterium]|jgi:preprotein translocase subunit SecG|nr:preprotein translocase subunit SecG [Pseudomonadota bacterium]